MTEITDISEQEIILREQNDKLQVLVADLNRRLENAHHMLDAQRKIVANANAYVEVLRNRQRSLYSTLRLEIAKNDAFHRDRIKDEEINRYEVFKNKANAMHDELRVALLDHSMGLIKKEPGRIVKMRHKLEKLEEQQDSQKLLLEHLNGLDLMIEKLSTAAQHGTLDDCRQLLRKGSAVNEKDAAGFLPLHYACARGDEDIVRLFLEHGSDLSSYLTGNSSNDVLNVTDSIT